MSNSFTCCVLAVICLSPFMTSHVLVYPECRRCTRELICCFGQMIFLLVLYAVYTFELKCLVDYYFTVSASCCLCWWFTCWWGTLELQILPVSKTAYSSSEEYYFFFKYSALKICRMPLQLYSSKAVVLEIFLAPGWFPWCAMQSAILLQTWACYFNGQGDIYSKVMQLHTSITSFFFSQSLLFSVRNVALLFIVVKCLQITLSLDFTDNTSTHIQQHLI